MFLTVLTGCLTSLGGRVKGLVENDLPVRDITTPGERSPLFRILWAGNLTALEV